MQTLNRDRCWRVAMASLRADGPCVTSCSCARGFGGFAPTNALLRTRRMRVDAAGSAAPSSLAGSSVGYFSAPGLRCPALCAGGRAVLSCACGVGRPKDEGRKKVGGKAHRGTRSSGTDTGGCRVCPWLEGRRPARSAALVLVAAGPCSSGVPGRRGRPARMAAVAPLVCHKGIVWSRHGAKSKLTRMRVPRCRFCVAA